MSTPLTLSSLANHLREFIKASSTDTSNRPGYVNLELQFENLALDLFQLQVQLNEPYRRFLQARGVEPSSVRHWTQIPFLPISAFKKSECSCLPAAERNRVFHSSGTSQQTSRSQHFHSLESMEVYEASALPWFHSHYLPDFDGWRGRLFGGPLDPPDFLFLTPSPAHCPHSSLVTMFGMIQKEFAPISSTFAGRVSADGSWSIDPKLVSSSLQQATDFLRPLYILGTALSCVELVALLESLTSNSQCALPAGSRLLETGGYKGRSISISPSELRKKLSLRLNLPPENIVAEYGMSELSSQAYDLVVGTPNPTPNGPPPPRSFRFPPWVRTRIVSPETGAEVRVGEAGLLQVLDLANVFSIAPIQTEDLAKRHIEGFELLGRAPGAVDKGCSLASHGVLPTPA